MSNTFNPVPDPTSLASVLAAIAASSQAYVDYMNARLTAQYQQAYANWLISEQNHPTLAGDPPVVPTGYALAPPDKDGWIWPIATDTPVCAAIVPPVDAPLVANAIEVGARLEGYGGARGAFYAVGLRDTWPPNKKTPPTECPDGETHILTKIPAPVGSKKVTLPDGTIAVMGGWYEIVA